MVMDTSHTILFLLSLCPATSINCVWITSFPKLELKVMITPTFLINYLCYHFEFFMICFVGTNAQLLSAQIALWVDVLTSFVFISYLCLLITLYNNHYTGIRRSTCYDWRSRTPNAEPKGWNCNQIKFWNWNCLRHLISLRSLIFSLTLKQESFQHQDTDIQIKLKLNIVTAELPRESLTISEQTRDANVGALSTEKVENFVPFSMLFQCLASYWSTSI